MNIDWDELADGTATEIEQIKGEFYAVKNGSYWCKKTNVWVNNCVPGKTVATRSKPNYTKEQMQAVVDYYYWASAKRKCENTAPYFFFEDSSQ